MPLLRIDLYEGRTKDEKKTLLDALHRAMLAAFKVPERDRYQIVHEHDPATMIMEDTGLDIPRTEKFVMIQVTTRPRTREQKEQFYRLTVEELQKKLRHRSVRRHDQLGVVHRRGLVVRLGARAIPDGRALGSTQSSRPARDPNPDRRRPPPRRRP